MNTHPSRPDGGIVLSFPPGFNHPTTKLIGHAPVIVMGTVAWEGWSTQKKEFPVYTLLP